jgi:thymidylate synthase (FAD)
MINVIKPSYEILDNSNAYKIIELAGRLCYKSEDKITEESYRPFIENLLKRKHYAVLEHGWITVILSKEIWEEVYSHNPKFLYLKDNTVSGNVRAWIEYLELFPNHYIQVCLNLEYDLFFKYVEYELEDLYECDVLDKNPVISVRFIHDRAFTHELVRHRIASYCQESQRYVNYSKEKFGGLTFIEPIFSTPEQMAIWHKAMMNASDDYLRLIELGAPPQEARTVLPNSTKTEIIITATEEEWKHIFELRCATAAHPAMRQVMISLREDLNHIYQ